MPTRRAKERSLAVTRTKANPLRPPYLSSPDVDYARTFRQLARLEVEMAREGATKERILRRAALRFALGNYLAAALDAERACRLDPHWDEAEYLRGQALLALAAVKHGVASNRLGSNVPLDALPARRHLLLTARACFAGILERNPGDWQAHCSLESAKALLADLSVAFPTPRGSPAGLAPARGP